MLILRYYLWIAPEVLCGVALLIAIRKKLYQQFPVFTTLLFFDSVVELSVTLVLGFFFSQSVYRWWLVLDTTAVFTLEVFLLYEIAAQLVSSIPSFRRAFQPLPRWTAAVLVLVATSLAAFIPQTAREQALNIFHTLGFGTNLVTIGLLLGMGLCTRVLGISWRGIPAGIMLGLGIVSATDLAALPLMAQLGKSTYIPIDIIRMISFHVCVVIWLVYLLLPQKTRRLGEKVQIALLQEHLHELERIVQH